eukprot:5696402-Alexandrium_andersonii.AAC.1
MYENLESAEVMDVLEALQRAAQNKGYAGMAVLRRKRMKGWLTYAEGTQSAAARLMPWREISRAGPDAGRGHGRALGATGRRADRRPGEPPSGHPAARRRGIEVAGRSPPEEGRRPGREGDPPPESGWHREVRRRHRSRQRSPLQRLLGEGHQGHLPGQDQVRHPAG